MSDHEVNIKILLDVLLREGAIANRKERNKILAEMTDEVSDLVLADNRIRRSRSRSTACAARRATTSSSTSSRT